MSTKLLCAGVCCKESVVVQFVITGSLPTMSSLKTLKKKVWFEFKYGFSWEFPSEQRETREKKGKEFEISGSVKEVSEGLRPLSGNKSVSRGIVLFI